LPSFSTDVTFTLLVTAEESGLLRIRDQARAPSRHPGCAQCNLAGYYLNDTGVSQNPVEAYIWGTMAVHCSTIRFRSAEVFRDQAMVLLSAEQLKNASEKIDRLKLRLPYEWSEHYEY
jgi:hypothetical protein